MPALKRRVNEHKAETQKPKKRGVNGRAHEEKAEPQKSKKRDVNDVLDTESSRNGTSKRVKHIWQDLSQETFLQTEVMDLVLTCGNGDAGQLGHGESRTEVTKPRRIDGEEAFPDGTKFLQIVAGAMHSAVLTADHKVYTWGCNECGVLGRSAEDDSDMSFWPGVVTIPKKYGNVVMLSAGDVHTAALTDKGAVFAWGTFRNKEGEIGLQPDNPKSVPNPVLVWSPSPDNSVEKIVKISSGCNHLVFLGETGRVLSMGSSDAGQLGRAATDRVRGAHNSRRLEPLPVVTPAKQIVDIHCLAYGVLAKGFDQKIYAWGLNNCEQLGVKSRGFQSYLVKVAKEFSNSENWKKFVGEHHVLALTDDGEVYGIGRAHDGRLCQPAGVEQCKDLVKITLPENEVVVDVAAGTSTSLAVTAEGHVFAWGFNANCELGLGKVEEDEKLVLQPRLVESKHLEGYAAKQVALGGQHAIFLARKL